MNRGHLTPQLGGAATAASAAGSAIAAPGAPAGSATQAASPATLFGAIHIAATYGTIPSPQSFDLGQLLASGILR